MGELGANPFHAAGQAEVVTLYKMVLCMYQKAAHNDKRFSKVLFSHALLQSGKNRFLENDNMGDYLIIWLPAWNLKGIYKSWLTRNGV